jgi:hypothetical protein
MVSCVVEADDKLVLLSIALSFDEQLMALLEERKSRCYTSFKIGHGQGYTSDWSSSNLLGT